MSALFSNRYHLRKVEQANYKPCVFCFKPTDTVLITSDGKSDFFYTCDIHLKDSSFAVPVRSEEYVKALQHKKEVESQIQVLKLKWDEKNRYSGWDKLVSKFSSSKEEASGASEKDSPSKGSPAKGSPAKGAPLKTPEEEVQINNLSKQITDYDSVLNAPPRIFELNKDIYKMRLDKKHKSRQSATLGRKIEDASFFPSVPQRSPEK